MRRTPAAYATGIDTSSAARNVSDATRSGLRGRRSTHAPAKNPTRSTARLPATTIKAISVGPAPRTRRATSGTAVRVTTDPSSETVCPVQSLRKSPCRQSDGAGAASRSITTHSLGARRGRRGAFWSRGFASRRGAEIRSGPPGRSHGQRPTHDQESVMHRSFQAGFLATLVALSLVLAACGSSSASPAPTAAATNAPAASAPAASAPGSSAPSSSAPAASSGAGGRGNAVTIANFSFAPSTLEVPVGTTVTWTNNDSTNHTATADDGSFDSKPISSGQTFTQTFSTAGTFKYHCSIHPAMTGTVTVK